MTGYPPLYYGVVGMVMRLGLKVGLSGHLTLVACRWISGMACWLLVGAALLVARKRFRVDAAVVAAVAFLTPMAVYLFAAINPNGVEIASGFAVAVGVAAVRQEVSVSHRVGLGLGIYLLTTVLVLSWSRPLGFVWAGLLCLTLLVPVLSKDGRRLPVRRLPGWVTACAVAIVALAFVWFLYAYSLRGPEGDDVQGWAGMSSLLRVVLIILKFGDLTEQGYGLLGWADTPLPSIGMVIWLLVSAASIAIFILGSRRRSTRFSLSVFFLSGALLAVFAESYLAAFGWQGRYVLPCLSSFVGLCIGSMGGRYVDRRAGRRAVVVCVGSFAILDAMGFFWDMWRYRYGYQVFYNRFSPLPWPDSSSGLGPSGGQALVISLYAIGLVVLVFAALRFVFSSEDGGGVRGMGCVPGSDSARFGSSVKDLSEDNSGRLKRSVAGEGRVG